MKKLVYLAAAILICFACTPKDKENILAQEVAATAIELSSHELTLEKGGNAILTVTYTPSDVTKKEIIWVSSNTSIATVTDGIVVAVALGNTEIIAKCGEAVDRCVITVVSEFPPEGAIDLGLSVYWATCNIGASKPEDYGDYFAWGETETKSDYSWLTYKWGTSSTSLTKYNTNNSNGTVDNKVVLDPEDDAAHVSLGGKWRMPTEAEWTELRTECTWTWTTQNGVNGRLVTGKNGNSIFLPAAGRRSHTNLNDAGSYGIYWSSSLDTGRPYDAWGMYFGSSFLLGDGYYRFFGQSIRPVTE